VVLGFVAVAARLVYLQVVQAPVATAQARDQRLRDVELSARRGTIYDREGEPLAVSIDARTVYATPNAVKDKQGTAKALAEILGGDPATYEAKLNRKSGFAYVARKVDVDQSHALEALELAGIGFLDDSKRTYPSGQLACQVLGFVGIDGDGLAGIEKQYDGVLAGSTGTLLAERDPFGRIIPGGVQKSVDPIDGHDVVLTIDKDIQYQAQFELAALVKQYKARGGTVLVMNPQTGEVYAMASTPTFDPNNYSDAAPGASRNRVVSDAYEPGSTIKSLTAASVLDAGVFKPDSKLTLPPSLKVAGRTIGEAHGRGTVTWSLAEIVTHSSNVGAVKLGQALKVKGLRDYFARFGLDEQSGIDFPGEAVGRLPRASDWTALSMSNIPFGQGLSLTPLQLSRAISAIANGGELVTPHLLLSLPQDPDTKPIWPRKRILKETAAQATNTILQQVVTLGTGKQAAVAGYSVAGKTGTAQKVRPGEKVYAKGAYVSSFIGYLPAEDPQVLVSVIIDEPRGVIYGGVVAAPTFSRLGAFTVSHLKIPPSSTGTSAPGVASATAEPTSSAR
jgi:cell division protein FtsI (penicillin-binding protein 3)